MTASKRGSMSAGGKVWAIVLAGGDGTRLSILTGDCAGNLVPKQFCSLTGGASLLEQTVARANTVVATERITTVVCAHHAQHWKSSLWMLDPQSIVVQPANRGTALGILLPLLRIIERDPAARVLILPSDHYVHDEAVLESAMRMALIELCCNPVGVALLGIEAEQADPELGYIVPGFEPRGRFDTVRRFVEKPPAEEADQLCNEGAVWNSFILVCRAQSLLALYLTRHREVVETLHASALCASPALDQRYSQLPPIDFSRDVVTGQESQLALMRVPRCGWNDLGTPQRLARTVARYHQSTASHRIASSSPRESRVNLAERLITTYPKFAGMAWGHATASMGTRAQRRSEARDNHSRRPTPDRGATFRL